MKYIVDIDNTICVTNGSKYFESQPILDRIKKINDLYKDGHIIVYWTARGGNSGIDWSELTDNQLKQWGCLYHELKMFKPSYDIWIDDRAINSENFFNEDPSNRS
jgi:hypothetical protein